MLKNKRIIVAVIAATMMIAMSGCGNQASEVHSRQAVEQNQVEWNANYDAAETSGDFVFGEVPAFQGEPYFVLNQNIPYFTADDLTTTPYETYGELDSLGRCGATMACIDQSLMPTEERGSIGQVKPTGWHTVKYDCVDGKYLYNRCHLIGFQLTAENANKENLITGTRYLNIEGMLPFENMVADYIRETNNPVLLRVTPVFEGDNMIATGVVMEAMSVKDNGADICFNVFCYNAQPGVVIDYATGESWLEGKSATNKEQLNSENNTSQGEEVQNFVLNTNSMKVHKPECSSAKDISAENRVDFSGTFGELKTRGYSSCGICKP